MCAPSRYENQPFIVPTGETSHTRRELVFVLQEDRPHTKGTQAGITCMIRFKRMITRGQGQGAACFASIGAFPWLQRGRRSVGPARLSSLLAELGHRLAIFGRYSCARYTKKYPLHDAAAAAAAASNRCRTHIDTMNTCRRADEELGSRDRKVFCGLLL